MKDMMTCGKAAWITYANPNGTAVREKKNPWETPIGAADQFAPIADVEGIALFRTSFTVSSLKTAKIDATAFGNFEIYVNGQRVGKKSDREDCGDYDEMKPGWTDFTKRVLYFSYDIASYLTEGQNTLLIAVAPGWYNGRISLNTYGETHIAALAAVSLEDAQGARTIYTDKTWEAAWGSAIRAADIWDGELYDANQPSPAALSVNGAPYAWGTPVEEERDVAVTPFVGSTINVRPNLSRKPATVVIYNGTDDNGSDYGKIHVVRTYENRNTFSLKKGESAVLDFTQNMVGWPTFTVKGGKGTTVQFRFGEMLNDSGLKSRGNDNPEGSIYSINYRSAKAKIYYILNGSGEEFYRPTFTFFGFRYCEITATEDVEIVNLIAEVVGSSNVETGKMETSHPYVNQLISNILWGQRGNYLSVPTDCPQRDERLGWTGDTQAFCCTAAYNANVDGFFHKWLQDARDSQSPAGLYPDVIPRSRVVGEGGAAWSDAGIIVPYTMWKMYNDTDLIREHYESMEKYMAWLETTNCAGPHAVYGDWLAYEGTDARYISVVYYALDARYMAAMSRAIGKDDRAAHYDEIYQQVRAHFQKTYCDENGDLIPAVRTQTGYLLALKQDLLDEKNVQPAVAALKQKIIDNGYKLSTGFVGSCILNEVLAEFGENDLAYSLLLQTENPSWLYSIYQGATTIWERWNSYTLATGFGDVGMNSFNHYAYGAVQEWMYRHVAGIETTEKDPGFAHPILQPKPDTRKPEEIPAGQEKITWAKTSFVSPNGLIVSNWDTRDGFTYECEVPVAATLRLPVLTDAETFTVNGVTHRFDEYKICPCCGKLVMELAPGKYTFIQK